MISRFKQWLCYHSWVIHWIYMPDGGIELKTCTKCGKSETLRMVQM